ncbi:MAG TPA: helix-turn-helix domain-containing protein [Puia sp.]|nr:helix-turn-helix domain-containing protein [Puia sp.]
MNLAVEVIGDKWTFLVIRDIIFYNRRHFNELLRLSEEGIASNILRDRLASLEKEGLITKGKDPEDSHKQKIKYSLTEKAIDLLPLMLEAMNWSIRYQPVNQEKYKPAIALAHAGPEVLTSFRKALLDKHGIRAAVN